MPLPIAKPFWYAITPDDSDDRRWRTHVAAVLAARPEVVQYRNKAADWSLRQQQAEWLVARAHEEGVTLVIINDDWQLAQALGAGVHLGREDRSVAEVRAQLGPQVVIGASCYDSHARAIEAVAAGASYVAFGAIFPSRTKPNARHVAPQIFRETATLGVPRVAIGGVTLERVPELLALGVEGVAVIGDLFARGTVAAIAARARAWRALFDRYQEAATSREPRAGEENGRE